MLVQIEIALGLLALVGSLGLTLHGVHSILSGRRFGKR